MVTIAGVCSLGFLPRGVQRPDSACRCSSWRRSGGWIFVRGFVPGLGGPPSENAWQPLATSLNYPIIPTEWAPLDTTVVLKSLAHSHAKSVFVLASRQVGTKIHVMFLA